MADDLSKLAGTIGLARRAERIIRANIACLCSPMRYSSLSRSRATRPSG